MSNKFHKDLVGDELHSPERFGGGDPNDNPPSLPVNGQYYQDTETGDVWRYVEDQEDEENSIWERLIAYDRATSLITNTSQELDSITSQIGELKVGIEEGQVITSIQAILFTPVRKGEEIEIQERSDPLKNIVLTVSASSEGGDVIISVQSQKAQFTINAGAVIRNESAQFAVYASADPTKIFRSLTEIREGETIGILAGNYSASQSYNSLVISNPTQRQVDLRVGQKLFIYSEADANEYGYNEVTVRTKIVTTAASFTLNVDTFTPNVAYSYGKAYITEAPYQTSSRITQNTDSIELSVRYQEVNGGTSEAYLGLFAGPTQSEIKLVADNVDIDNLFSSSISLKTASGFIQSENYPTQGGFKITSGGSATFDNIFAKGIFNSTEAVDFESDFTQNADDLDVSNVTEAFNQTIDGQTGAYEGTLGAGTVVHYVFRDDAFIAGEAYRLDFKFYIPSTNVSMNGIRIGTNSTNDAEFDYDLTDAWVVRTVAFDAISGTQLRFTALFFDPSANDTFDGEDDVFYLKEIKITRLTRIAGEYLTDDSLDGIKIKDGAITATKIDVDNLEAVNATTGSLTVDGTLTMTGSGAKISGINYEFTSVGGNVAGWIINSDNLSSGVNGAARINLSKANKRVSIINSSNAEIVAMGYLDGLPKNDGSGNFPTGTYGFWAKTGDKLEIDGDVDYTDGNFIIQAEGLLQSTNFQAGTAGFQIKGNGDAEFNSVTVRGNIQAGTGSSIDGGYITANTITATQIAALTITGTQIAATTITGSKIAASTITGSKIAANTITASNIEAATITTAEIASGTITTGNIAALAITSGLIAANAITAAKIEAGTITATELAANSVTADKIDVTNLAAVSGTMGALSIDSRLTIGAGGDIYFDNVDNRKIILDDEGVTIQTDDNGLGYLTLRDPAASSTYRFSVDSSGYLLLSGLPTTSPGGSNRIWNDSGTIKIT